MLRNGGLDVVMPARANSLKSAFIAGTLAAVALLSFSTTASSATECPENPHLRTVQPGHWYHRSDRTRHRRCWFFVPAEVRPAPDPHAATVAGDSRQSWLPFFTPGLLLPPPPPPQQMEATQTQQDTTPDRSGEATQTISPKPARRNKTVRRERPPIARYSRISSSGSWIGTYSAARDGPKAVMSL